MKVETSNFERSLNRYCNTVLTMENGAEKLYFKNYFKIVDVIIEKNVYFRIDNLLELVKLKDGT